MNTVLKESIVSEPDWFTKDRFALQAKTDSPASLDEMRQMLQQMLAERFSLKAHGESPMHYIAGWRIHLAKRLPAVIATPAA